MGQRTVPMADLLAFTRRCIEFPYPQVCKHLVAVELLDLLAKRGLPEDEDFYAVVREVVEANDGEAIQRLNALALREETLR